ncbi:hypothetical protein DITRI_Ditri13aG0143500 [Diplodiscus trichospermus]
MLAINILWFFHEQKRHGNQAVPCSVCDEPVIGPAYCCTFCEFRLHERCAKLPSIILNPIHPQHRLTLLAKSPYPNGIYMCDMCENTRKRFLYHCSDCDFDLEISCAFHSKLTSKFDIPGGIIINARAGRDLISKEERQPQLGKRGKIELERTKGKAFEAKGSREEKKHIHAEIYEIEMTIQVMMDRLKNLLEMEDKILYGRETDKLDTFGGKQRSSLDFGKKDFRLPLIPMEQIISQAKTDEPDGFFRGKKIYKIYLKSDKGKDMVKKEKKQERLKNHLLTVHLLSSLELFFPN